MIDELEIELQETTDELEVEDITVGDYTPLTNKPKINNIELVGNKTSSDLGLVDEATLDDYYTSEEVDDLLDDYVQKESGKGLSQNDFTNTLKTKLDGISEGAEVNVQSDWNETDSTKDDYIKNKPTIPSLSNYYTKTETNDLLDDKVDKVSGKQLSTNDYTNEDKLKVQSAIDKDVNNLTNYRTITNQDLIDNSKVDKIEGKGLSENDYTDTDKSLVESALQPSALDNYRTASAQDLIDLGLQTDIDNIETLIPSQATSSNQLADKNFVNSSIATSTATFRGTSATGLTEAQFLAWADSLTHDDNDYVYWNTTDSDGNTLFKRYKYDGTQWLYEYTLNNSSFTASQWATIQSGLTASDKTKLDTIETNAQVNMVDTFQIGGVVQTITDKTFNVPIANGNIKGIISANGGYGLNVDNGGQPYSYPLTYAQYLSKSQFYIIGKGTLENVLDNETTRVDKEQSLTDTQKQQARSNIGAISLADLPIYDGGVS